MDINSKEIKGKVLMNDNCVRVCMHMICEWILSSFIFINRTCILSVCSVDCLLSGERDRDTV